MSTLPDRPRPRLSPKQIRERLRAARRERARKARAARHERARKARATRRKIDRNHQQLPQPVRTILDPFEPVFTRPTYRRFVLLALAAILTLGGRTISNLLRFLGVLAPGHPSSYHRFFSRDRWSLSALARRYIAAVLARFVAEGTDPPGRRRHRHRAPRPQGLRQGPPSRPGPIHSFVHRVSLGAQVGRPGSVGPRPLGDPTLGLAPSGGTLSAQVGQQKLGNGTKRRPNCSVR